MRSTPDILDSHYLRAKSALAGKPRPRVASDKPWMKSFGKLRDLHEETARINGIMDDEFERID